MAGWPEHRLWPRGGHGRAEWGLAQERHVVYMRMDGMRPACVDTCESVRHGPREGMLAGSHMYVDKGRWTYPDLVPLRAAKLEIKECWSQRPTVKNVVLAEAYSFEHSGTHLHS